MIVDVHTHVGYTKYIGEKLNAERVLKIMDETGVDKAVLLPALSAGKILEPYKMVEEVKKAPDRLVAFTAVNPKEKDAPDKLEEAVVKYGARGLKIHPTFQALPADDEVWVYPLMEKARELKIPVMFHSGEGPYALPWQIGLVAMDFPEVTVIMAHMGLNSISYTEGAIKMAKKAKNLVLETAGVVYDNPITKACQAIGGERIVFGSDAPINNPIHEIRKIQVAKISDEDKRKILGENMARILGLWGY